MQPTAGRAAPDGDKTYGLKAEACSQPIGLLTRLLQQKRLDPGSVELSVRVIDLSRILRADLQEQGHQDANRVRHLGLIGL